MRLPVKSPELLLKCEEYVDTWDSLIQAFYRRIISDDAVYAALHLDENGNMRFSMELGTVLLVMAMRAWNRKKLREDIRKKVEANITHVVCTGLFAADGETLQACLDLYAARYRLLGELSPLDAAKNADQRRAQIIGFARFTVAQCSDREEKQNAAVIEKLSVHLIAATETFLRLTDNTTLDGNSLLGKKFRFIVKK
ncbi:MAG: hypothetical protein VB071_03400 [Lawsonibacter sp.]|nr:hypothetical protein [Lawsonibacter sp.]